MYKLKWWLLILICIASIAAAAYIEFDWVRPSRWQKKETTKQETQDTYENVQTFMEANCIL